MDNSPLGRLPGEIRNKIYEYALRDYRGLVRMVLRKPTKKKPAVQLLFPGNRSSHNGLPSTCKEVRQESRAIYFAMNSFEVEVFERRIAINAVANALGADMMQHIRRFDLAYPKLDLHMQNDGTIIQKRACAVFYRTRRMIANSLGNASLMTCMIEISAGPKFLHGLFTDQRMLEDMRDLDRAMHSIGCALRLAREFLEIDETTRDYARSMAAVRLKLSV